MDSTHGTHWLYNLWINSLNKIKSKEKFKPILLPKKEDNKNG